jgi:alkylhydroperoxidase/carboxymuconolactone decarboxylase family protein YurZ
MKFDEFSVSDVLEVTSKNSSLTDREKHLIGLAVTTTRGCIKCTGSRIKKALASDISYQSILDGINLTAAVNAGVTLAIAIQGAEREGISGQCSDGACAVGV